MIDSHNIPIDAPPNYPEHHSFESKEDTKKRRALSYDGEGSALLIGPRSRDHPIIHSFFTST